MLHARGALVWRLLVLLEACRAAPQSGAGTIANPSAGFAQKSLEGRRLHGRFLHITDIHPDPFYKTYSSTEQDAACHRKRGPAGVYGAETSACDTPYSLVNETFKWINRHLKDSIDFVVWTGDSARHDSDERIPRTQKQIIEQNEFVVSKFTQVFGKDDNINDTDPTNDFIVPIVPTFGNNDIMPHNIFLGGPNRWTSKYLDIWRGFVPEAQRHQFHQGGWFYVEVIPGKLAVISLNTMYFFASNSGVDGCANKKEPGYEHMEWLRIQLQLMRERGVKAILMGHVPPARVDSKESWDETCWQKFTLWERQYRDIIVASLFGHMNIDHFMLQDFKELSKDTKRGKMADSGGMKSKELHESLLEDGEITVASASDYLIDLRDAWAKLPAPPKPTRKSLSISEYVDADEEEGFSIWQWVVSKLSSSEKDPKKDDKKKFLDEIGGRYGERFSIAHVAPSVVPNYFPTLRVFSYNISGLEDHVPTKQTTRSIWDSSVHQAPFKDESFSDDAEWENEVEEIIALKRKRKEKDALKKPKKYKFKVPSPPSKSAPPGPAYSPQSLTLLGYVQYFANLTHINNDFVNRSLSVNEEGEGSIFGLDISEEGEIEQQRWKEGKHKEHQGKQPRPRPHPKKFKYEVEYDTTKDKVFKLNDLTVRSYVDLARRIAEELSKTADIDHVADDSLETDSKDKKKGKKKKKYHKHSKNKAWYTFVKRAFVGTMDPHEIEEVFGVSEPPQAEQEILEL